MGLLIDDRLGMYKHPRRHFFSIMSGHIMHENGGWLSARHQFRANSITFKCFDAFRLLGFLAHAGPHIGIYNIGVGNCLNRVNDGQYFGMTVSVLALVGAAATAALQVTWAVPVGLLTVGATATGVTLAISSGHRPTTKDFGDLLVIARERRAEDVAVAEGDFDTEAE